MLIFTAVSIASCDKIGKPEDPEDPKKEVCEICGEDPCVCENENTDPEPEPDPEPDPEPTPGTDPLQPSEQKEKLSSVGQKLLDKTPAAEWEAYSKLVEDFSNSVYASEDYDWGTMEEWFEEEFNEAYKEDEKLTIAGGKYTTSWTNDIIILMSNHTGLFTFTESGVVISDYNDGTKAVFTLNGKTYAVEIKSSGKVTEAKYVWEEYGTWTEYGYYDPNLDEWVYTDEPITRDDFDKISVTVGVPEQIDLNITEDGSPLATVTMKLTPSFKAEEASLTTDSFSVKTTVSINGFEVVSEKVAFDAATGKASAKAEFKKNGECLIKTSAAADVKLHTEDYTWEDSSDSYGTYEYVVLDMAKNIDVSMDIIGEIQVKGTCSNAVEASESLEAMWDALYDGNTANMTEAKRHLDNFNSKFKLNVYYDGTDVKQATVAFDLETYEDEYYDYVDYDLIPIIIFEDKSKYKVEEFFTENAFGSLIDSFEALCESFNELFAFED